MKEKRQPQQKEKVNQQTNSRFVTPSTNIKTTHTQREKERDAPVFSKRKKCNSIVIALTENNVEELIEKELKIMITMIKQLIEGKDKEMNKIKTLMQDRKTEFEWE